MTRRPGALWPLIAVIGFLAAGAFVGGSSFLTDPSGRSLQANLEWLAKTPVNDFFWPGVFLLLVYGIGGVLLIVGLGWRIGSRKPSQIERRTGHHWAWGGSILVGLILVVWILYEFVIFSDRIILQPILIGVGAMMIAIPLLPSMRRYLAVPPARTDDPAEAQVRA